FAAFVDAAGVQVVSASPERFLRLDADRRAESRPIKGTRPRGRDPAADARLRDELVGSSKDRAENIMIVDLVRSDLGRVCATGSVAVPELLAVETYATVHQLVSTVRGRLRLDRDAIDLVRACFPGGSMTGAPKIAAMGVIDAEEPAARGVYSGALGYLDRGGAMDLSIVIRTLVCTGKSATFGVGGAVTADSDPDAEYEEAMAKGRAMVEALGQVR
ncbi:MAG: anthranilate synthase component I family protein, partial [Candidatus Krumholzibacteriia bacterium]